MSARQTSGPSARTFIYFVSFLSVFFCRGEEEDDDDEWEDTDEEGDFDSEGGFSDDGGHAREFFFTDEETRSRFTEYSMTSSVMRRNEQLTLLDDRFEKVGVAEPDD